MKRHFSSILCIVIIICMSIGSMFSYAGELSEENPYIDEYVEQSAEEQVDYAEPSAEEQVEYVEPSYDEPLEYIESSGEDQLEYAEDPAGYPEDIYYDPAAYEADPDPEESKNKTAPETDGSINKTSPETDGSISEESLNGSEDISEDTEAPDPANIEDPQEEAIPEPAADDAEAESDISDGETVSTSDEEDSEHETAETDQETGSEDEDSELTVCQVVDSGMCGESATWQYDDNGTLTISGSGDMDNYDLWDAPVPWGSYLSSIKNIVIDKGVTSIGNWAFHDFINMTGISIPNSVTSIGGYAFQRCSSLTSIMIPDSVTKINNYAFDECSGLVSITLPANITNIGQDVFMRCSSLASITIPAGVTSIGISAFGYCSSLESITIPASVTSISNNAFEYCTSLESIVVESGNTVFDSRNGCNAIIETASNTLVRGCKNTVIPSSVTSIGDSAFWYCDSLTSITIPSSVTVIGVDAFHGCSSLVSITIPASVTSIGHFAFEGCSSLASVTISEGVATINNFAFAYCSSLESIYIPASATIIGRGLFFCCDKLVSVTVDKNNTVYDSRDNCNAIIESASNVLIDGCLASTIPESVTCIGDNAFRACKNLTSIALHAGITSIGEDAFYSCSSLRSITIPDGITGIAHSLFESCSSLARIKIPASVKSIANYAFWQCNSLTDVYFCGTEEEWNAVTIGRYGNEVLSTVTIHFNSKDDCIHETTESVPAVAPTCTETGLTEGSYCPVCGETVVAQEEVPALGHDLKRIRARAATTTSEGNIEYYQCNRCQKLFSDAEGKNEITAASVVIPKLAITVGITASVTSYNLASGIQVDWEPVDGAAGYYIWRKAGSGSYSFLKTISGGSNTSYTDTTATSNGKVYIYLIYTYAKANGTTVYSDDCNYSFTYRLTRPTISSVTNSASRKMTVKWNKNAKAVGYVIQYSQKSSFASSKYIVASKATTVSKVISSLTKGKTYYVRMCSYKVYGGVTHYSDWSNVKTVKIAK